MCGRIALFTEPERIARIVDARLAEGASDEWRPSWNVGPTSRVLAVGEDDRGRVLDRYRWGLVPAWAKDPSAITSTFNARAETVATKPMFRSAFTRRRVLVPVDAFYEWRAGAPKQPFAFTRADGDPVVLAGLREWWRGDDGTELRTVTVVTCAAGPDMPIHDRQPVVLETGSWDRWLDPAVTDRDELQSMLRPTAPGTLIRHPVSRRIGNVRSDGPELFEEVDLPG
ncbi:MAG: SOS response-associated peptidase [Acidimicrobiales bacterium]